MNGNAPMSENTFFDIATWLLPLVVAIVLHEISHGWVANAFGDSTARRLGRLSPNPIRHVDPIGTIVLPLFLALAHLPVFGWAKPVPVVASRMRRPRLHMVLVALAGPGMNLLLALLAAIGLALIAPVGPGAAPGMVFLGANLENFLLINVFLAVFNMLPIPPFDGGHVVEGLLPRRAVPAWKRLGRLGFPLLVLLLVVLPMLAPKANIVSWLVIPPVRLLTALLARLVGLG
jgi:Zn-dependent protease